MSFTIKIDDGKTFTGIIESLSNIIDETKIKVNESGLILSAFDPSRICLLKLTLKKEDFDEYKCSGEFDIGINLDDLTKILRRSGSKDGFVISFNEEEQKIRIQIVNMDKTKRKRTHSLALLDLDIDEIPFENLDKLEYGSNWIMEPSDLIEAVKDGEIYSEVLTIGSIENEALTFESSGQIGEMTYEIGVEELEACEIGETSSSSFSLIFIKSILNLGSVTKEMEVSLRQDHPLKIIFTLNNGSELIYYLAPRVEQEDEIDNDVDEV